MKFKAQIEIFMTSLNIQFNLSSIEGTKVWILESYLHHDVAEFVMS